MSRYDEAAHNPTTNEKIAIGVGLALGVGGLIFLFTRPSAAAQKKDEGSTQPALPPNNIREGEPGPPPPPPPPVDGGVPIDGAGHALLDAAAAALKNADATLANYNNTQTQQAHDAWVTAWNNAYNAMSAAARGGQIGTGALPTAATVALAVADTRQKDQASAQIALAAAQFSPNPQIIEAAENALTAAQLVLDQARSAAYSAMAAAIQYLLNPTVPQVAQNLMEVFQNNFA